MLFGRKKKAYIQWKVDRMLDGKPCEFEDYAMRRYANEKERIEEKFEKY